MVVICFQDTLNSLTQRLIENDTVLRRTEDSPAATAPLWLESLGPINQHNNKHHSFLYDRPNLTQLSVCVCVYLSVFVSEP